MKDLYKNKAGDEPSWFVGLCDWLEDSIVGLFLWRVWKGYGSKWCGIKYLPKNTKWYLQRIFRGYSDDQLWSLDYHLGRHIIKCLKAFKKMDKCGVPIEYVGGFENKKKISMKVAMKNRNNDIQDMIDGFDFLTNKGDYYHDVCLKKYPSDSKKRSAMFNQAYNEATVKAQKFIQHFNDLWD